jgi:hypothetical protein
MHGRPGHAQGGAASWLPSVTPAASRIPASAHCTLAASARPPPTALCPRSDASCPPLLRTPTPTRRPFSPPACAPALGLRSGRADPPRWIHSTPGPAGARQKGWPRPGRRPASARRPTRSASAPSPTTCPPTAAAPARTSRHTCSSTPQILICWATTTPTSATATRSAAALAIRPRAQAPARRRPRCVRRRRLRSARSPARHRTRACRCAAMRRRRQAIRATRSRVHLRMPTPLAAVLASRRSRRTTTPRPTTPRTRRGLAEDARARLPLAIRGSAGLRRQCPPLRMPDSRGRCHATRRSTG